MGLGGTGQEVIRRLKREMLRHEYISPLFQYLVLDTVPFNEDPGINPLMKLSNGREYLYFGGYSSDEILKSPDSGSTTLNWWSTQDQINQIALDEGAGQIRLAGRQRFFRHFKDIRQQFERSIQEMMNSSDVGIKGYGTPEDDTPVIFIVFSLCGGTGSSIFFDVAYILKELLDIKPRVVGLALLPGPYIQDIGSIAQQVRLQANTYAALQEMERLYRLAFRQEERLNGIDIWDIKYTPDFRVSSQELPFDYIYLFDDTTTASKRYRKEDVYDLMSQSIFWLSGPSTAPRFWERTRNLTSTFNTEVHESSIPLKLSKYSILGMSTIVLTRVQYELENLIIEKLQTTSAIKPALLGKFISVELLAEEVSGEQSGVNPLPPTKALRPRGTIKDQVAVFEMLERYTVIYQAVLNSILQSVVWQRNKETYKSSMITAIDDHIRDSLCSRGPNATLQELEHVRERLNLMLARSIEHNQVSMQRSAELDDTYVLETYVAPRKNVLSQIVKQLQSFFGKLYLFRVFRASSTSRGLTVEATQAAHQRYLWFEDKFHILIFSDIARFILEPVITHIDNQKAVLGDLKSWLEARLDRNRGLYNVQGDIGEQANVERLHSRLSEKDLVDKSIKVGNVKHDVMLNEVMKKAFNDWPKVSGEAIAALKSALEEVAVETLQVIGRQEYLAKHLLVEDVERQFDIFLQRAEYLCDIEKNDHHAASYLESINILGIGTGENQRDDNVGIQDVGHQLDTLLRNHNLKVELVLTDINDKFVLLKTLHGLPIYLLHSLPELHKAYQSIKTKNEAPYLDLDYTDPAIAYTSQSWQKLTALISTKERSLPKELLEDIVNSLTSSLHVTASIETLRTENSQLCWTLLDVRTLFDNIHMPRQLPVILYTSYHFDEDDADALHRLMKKVAPNLRLALMLFFMEADSVKEASRLLKDSLQQVHAYDIVPMDYREFLSIIVAKDPQKAFRRLILSKVDLNLVSPFIINGPTSDIMFFGREHELRVISEHAATTSYAIIGGRRIGKTSLLRRLERVRLPGAGFQAFYHDCSYTPTPAELIQAVALDKTWFSNASSATSLTQIIQTLFDGKPLVILFDEVDKLLKEDCSNGYPFFNTLRSLANAGHCYFVFSGEQFLRNELKNPNSPLYNFANELLVGHLDLPAVRELVTRPIKQMEVELADEGKIVQRIWDFTAGHPNIVQRLCQRLIAQLNQSKVLRLTLKDIESVIVDPDFLRTDFLGTYWERATVLERLCSLVIAKNSSLCSLTVVHKALADLTLNPTLNQVNSALERLVDLRNILQRTLEGYKFAVIAFPEVISKTGRLSDLIALDCEFFRLYGDV